jgi:hypothetical protein
MMAKLLKGMAKRTPIVPRLKVQKLKAKTIITGFMPIFFSIIRGVSTISSMRLARTNTPLEIEKKKRKLCGFSADNTIQPNAMGMSSK